jgi:hypothetical protein
VYEVRFGSAASNERRYLQAELDPEGMVVGEVPGDHRPASGSPRKSAGERQNKSPLSDSNRRPPLYFSVLLATQNRGLQTRDLAGFGVTVDDELSIVIVDSGSKG